MNWALDNYNYANDARTKGEAKAPVLYFAGCDKCGEPVEYKQLDGWTMLQTCECTDFEYCEMEKELPMKWAVCPVCRGEGKHVNPSIDAGGLNAGMIDDDPEFMENYMGGTYDVTCDRCRGKRVVPDVDWDALNDDEREAYEKQLDDEAASHAEHLAEIRMGA